METYLPVIQATLAEWLQLTIDHPLYAAALVIGVWLLTALLYSIKIAGLNKKNVASERSRTTAETNLNTAQQQRQQVQDELAAVTEQLEQTQQLVTAEKQRALASEQQLIQRNQHCAATIQNLASSFDIGERPLPVPENLKADDLWQQHDKVIKQLIERLRTEQQAKIELEKFYQAEKTKLAETQTQLDSLQTNLDSQTSLVLALQTQTTTLQQQQNDTKRDLTDALKKHQADLARLLQLEQQASQFTHTQPHLDTAPIAPVAPIQPVVIEKTALSFSVEADETANKLQDLFKKAQQPPVSVIPENEATPLVQAVEQVVEQPEVVPAPPVIEFEPLATVEPVAETPEKTSKVSALKGLYQKFTTSKPEQVEPAHVVPVAESIPAIKVEAVEKTLEKPSNTGQLKGLYKKYTTKRHEKDLAPESFDNSSSNLEDTADKITEKLEQMKGLYGKFFSKKE